LRGRIFPALRDGPLPPHLPTKLEQLFEEENYVEAQEPGDAEGRLLAGLVGAGLVGAGPAKREEGGATTVRRSTVRPSSRP